MNLPEAFVSPAAPSDSLPQTVVSSNEAIQHARYSERNLKYSVLKTDGNKLGTEKQATYIGVQNRAEPGEGLGPGPGPGSGSGPGADSGASKTATIFGLRRRLFWVLLVVALVVVAASIGGGVGGSLAAVQPRKASSQQESSSSETTSKISIHSADTATTQTQATTASPTSSPTQAQTHHPTVTTTDSSSSSSSSSSSASPSFLNNQTEPSPGFAFQGFSDADYLGNATDIIRQEGFLNLPFACNSYVWLPNGTSCCITFCQNKTVAVGWWCNERRQTDASVSFPRVWIGCGSDAHQEHACS